MIKSIMIKKDVCYDWRGNKVDYVFVKFDDGSFVAFDEEQLKNAAACVVFLTASQFCSIANLAEKGYLHD